MQRKKRIRAQVHRRAARASEANTAHIKQAREARGITPAGTAWHAVQRSLGNRGVQRLLAAHATLGAPSAAVGSVLQRALSAKEKAQDLTATRFAGDTRLEAAFDNSPAMRRGEKSDAVAKVQQALVDDGFEMPVSTRKTGSPDGIYGKETRDAIRKFQGTYGLGVDGVVGRETLGQLDKLYAGPAPKKTQPKEEPEIGVTQSEIGKHIVDDMDKANDRRNHTASSGIWYNHNYEAMHKKRPAQYPWTPDYRSGYTNPAYFVRINWMDWLLKPGRSASAGIKAWLQGLTIAECNSALVAIQINALRAAIGDAKFDREHGSADKPVPPQKRLRIKTGIKGTPLEKHIKWVDLDKQGGAGTEGNRPAKLGGWYYFYNHPKYLLKHPDGAFQGENAIYAGRNDAGEQTWSGLGVSNVTERNMLKIMAGAHNDPRTEADYRKLIRRYAPDAPELKLPNPNYPALYVKYIDRIETKFRHDKGVYPDQINDDQILSAPEYELWGTKRKGGFVSQAKLLDLNKIEALRNS